MAERDQALAIEANRFRLLLKQAPVALAANAVNATIVAVVLSPVVSLSSLVWWWAAILILVSVRLMFWVRQYRRMRVAPADIERSLRLSLVGAALSGVLWGGASILLFPQAETYRLFLAFVIGGMAAGATASLAYHLPTYFSFAVPALLPLAARFLASGSRVDLAMGLLVLIYGAALALIARNQNLTLTHALQLQLEKGRLVDELAAVLKDLERRVEERTRELRQTNLRLTQEIGEREKAEQAERSARAEADRANAAKSRFLAAASHDLRQPLQALHLFLGALARETAPERREAIQQRMTNTLNALQELMHTLMDLSALESGQLRPQLQAVQLDELLTRIADEYRMQVAAKGLGLKVRVSEPVSTVLSDRVLLERMVRNLVTNAVRHTDTGRILLNCRSRKDHLCIEVWDTGTGIAPERLQSIFEEFYQIPVDGERPPGLGLGLSIVARMARLLGYEVHVKSRPGHGSVFSIKIPPTAIQPTEGQPGGVERHD